MTTSILDVIQHYQRSIERSQDNKERLLHCISKLYKLPVKVEHLQDTGIGKTVNSLRKFNGEIGVAAKALVTKWKAMVAAEEELHAVSSSNDRDISVSSAEKSKDEDQCSQNNTFEVKEHSHEHEKAEAKDETHTERKREQTYTGTGDKSNDVKVSISLHKSASKNKESNDSLKKDETSQHSNSHDRRERRDRVKEQNTASRKKEDRSEKHIDHKKYSNGSKETSKDKTLPYNKESNSGDGSKKRKRESSSHEERRHKSKPTSSGEARSRKHQLEDKHHEDKKSHRTDKHVLEKKTTSTSNPLISSGNNSTSSTDNHEHRHNLKRESTDHHTSKSKSHKAHDSTRMETNCDADDGFDCSTGANFSDVLDMLNVPTKKSKKAHVSSNAPTTSKIDTSTKASNDGSLNGVKKTSSSSKVSSEIKPDLLSSSAKLEPLDPSIVLDLPSISANYKPLPLNPTVMDCVFNTSTSSSSKVPSRTLIDALQQGISSKTIRTKIYSGIRSGQTFQVPSLFDLCIRFLQKNIDALEYTGGVPFDILRPVIERATPQQLFVFEEYNPYLLEDSDALWKQHVQRNYRSEKRQELESWREMYLRCREHQDKKLTILAESIKQSQKVIAAPVRKTQLAYVDSLAKPPRNILRKQEQFGTRAKLVATPASRVAALSSVAPNAARIGDVRLRVLPGTRDSAQVSNSVLKPKKAPLMAKALQIMRGRNKR